MDVDSDNVAQPSQQHDQEPQVTQDTGTSSSQSLPQSQSVTNSQVSIVTATTDQVVTPPASDTSGGMDSHGAKDGISSDGRGPEASYGSSSRDSQLLQLSAIAAAQDRLGQDVAGSSRKRMADGQVKLREGSASPVKGHSRTTSAISMASTTGSTIGEVCLHTEAKQDWKPNADLSQLSSELKTRLSYAMVKVNHGWQTRSLDEVESLASRAASPTSSTSTIHRRQGSSASPRLAASAPATQVHFAHDQTMLRRKSNSPPFASSNKPALAPPATIQPSSSMPAPRSNSRRNSNPRYTPTLLSYSHSASPRGNAISTLLTPVTNGYPNSQSSVDHVMYSPHKNVREQDAIESLLFMSSPGNSANLKHAFSPTGSPGPSQSNDPPRSISDRHALPSGPRRGLPSTRPAVSNKKVEFDRSPIMPPPHSPMDLDSPHQQYFAPNKSAPKRNAGNSSSGARQHRSALSLPSGLGLGNGTARKVLRDEDIERMLDRAGAELGDSSDDEEIQLPPGRRGLAARLAT